jgi:hypothetical protein
MYILSEDIPSPGIEPRTPTVLGWSLGLQTSTVAHNSRDFNSACAPIRVAPVLAGAELATAGAPALTASAATSADAWANVGVRMR